jgi:hypothetical protein
MLLNEVFRIDTSRNFPKTPLKAEPSTLMLVFVTGRFLVLTVDRTASGKKIIDIFFTLSFLLLS